MATIKGDDKKNVLTGTAGDDIIYGFDGQDELNGGDGNDILNGGKHKDVLNGGNGIDTADYSDAAAGVAVLFGATDGNGVGQHYTNKSAGGYAGDANGDSFVSIERFVGSKFNDIVGGGTVAMSFELDAGNDIFDTNQSTLIVVGDTVDGGAGNDTAWGGYGNDLLKGGADNDSLWGEQDHDMLDGGSGIDMLDGGDGNDTLVGGADADKLIGGAGIDLVDYSASAAAVTVDLGKGTGSGGDASGDTFATVENAIGSAFNDRLSGDTVSNLLDGGAGDDVLNGNAGLDTLRGGEGDDILIGGAGADIIAGGNGFDRADYRDSAAGVTVSLLTNLGLGGDAEGDVLSGIEYLSGSNHADVLTGDAGVNRLVGRQGSDTLDGGAGDDILVSGGGYDYLNGGAGTQDAVDYSDSWGCVFINLLTNVNSGAEAANDTIVGVEYVVGSAFDDRITGDANINRLTGKAGMDTLDGGDGNDILAGGDGADRLIGGLGDRDAADYQGASAAVTVNLATGGTGGEAAGDTYSGVEFVYGSAFDDALTGDAAINRLTGGLGNDSLDGAAGNDYLLGEAGNDVLTGGLGQDVFYFKPNFGNDTVTDFEAGAGRTDRLWLDGFGLTGFADLLAHATDVGSGVVLDFGAKGSITLQGVHAANLVADDFIF